MNNMKIKVNSEAESKEVQELFFELGAKPRSILENWKNEDYKVAWFALGKSGILNNEIIFRDNDSGISCSSMYKEITLPELRDLVVLKRNDVGDANYKTNYGTQCYITGEDVYAFQDNKWFLSAMQHKDILDMIKPIKKPMKEYLRKNSNGTYSYIGTVRPEHVSDFMIEIPEGATYYAKDANLGKNGNFFFRLRSDDFDFDFEAVWLESNWIQAIFNVENQDVLWQRHTHPEELPFIDDEPLQGLNDQYAEIEMVRQSHRTASETADPTIKETLSQRQSQYGSFEDVAMLTEQMVDVMRKGYYEKLAYNQKMALYMICSKMARIVNGDPNHKDSWHDIAGYATLIDNELVSEKDMPF